MVGCGNTIHSEVRGDPIDAKLREDVTTEIPVERIFVGKMAEVFHEVSRCGDTIALLGPPKPAPRREGANRSCTRPSGPAVALFRILTSGVAPAARVVRPPWTRDSANTRICPSAAGEPSRLPWPRVPRVPRWRGRAWRGASPLPCGRRDLRRVERYVSSSLPCCPAVDGAPRGRWSAFRPGYTAHNPPHQNSRSPPARARRGVSPWASRPANRRPPCSTPR